MRDWFDVTQPAPAIPVEPLEFRRKGVREARPLAYVVLYVALYAAFGAASPFWPKFFETKTVSAQQIGELLAAAMLVRLVSGPVVAALADLLGSLRLVLAGCAIVAGAASAALLRADTFVLLLLAALVQAAALAPTTAIADALSVNAAPQQRAGRAFEYGWIRGAGSASFVLGTLAVGQLITSTDLAPVLWVNAILLIAAAGATVWVPPPATQAASMGGIRSAADKVFAVLKIAGFRSVIAVSALVYGSHAMHDAFAVIRWSDSGLPASTISFLWSEAVLAEVFVFLFIGPVMLDRLGARGAAIVAAAAGVVRWSVAGLTTSVLLLSLIQPLHGLTFALLHLACMRLVRAVIPISIAATAQALYAFGSGLVTALLTLVSGAIYARYAGAAFLPMAGLCVVAFPFAWFGFARRTVRSGTFG
ncbi:MULTISPECIES: MFS transporter [unclassified Bradyrhizobium]|uniref:MFS transporter n=1 Tax=unclassified Bradyrhizobium TaxID=2631580 RepID=UPI001FF75CE1